MTIRDAYSTWAATYDTDRNLTRDLDQQVTRQRLEGQRVGQLLELGCGTGKNTAFLVTIADRVLALDFSEGMIAQAKAKPLPGTVSFAVADLTQPWPCADGTVDLIVCNLVLEHIAELTDVFTEAHRILTDAGRFFISELHPFKQYQGKKATFQQGDQQTDIPAYIHHLSAFFEAGDAAGFTLSDLREWWHEADQGLPPRLVTLLFEKRAQTPKNSVK